VGSSVVGPRCSWLVFLFFAVGTLHAPEGVAGRLDHLRHPTMIVAKPLTVLKQELIQTTSSSIADSESPGSEPSCSARRWRSAHRRPR
jgi:hypothetical protein